MKTKDELNALREEYESLSKKLTELSEEELAQVVGGIAGLLPYDHYENIILSAPDSDKILAQKYKKDIGSDKNAKVIFN